MFYQQLEDVILLDLAWFDLINEDCHILHYDCEIIGLSKKFVRK